MPVPTLNSIIDLQNQMKTAAQQGIEADSLNTVKAKVGLLRNLNSSICQKAGLLSTRTYSVFGKTWQNANSIRNYHEQISPLLNRFNNINNVEEAKPILQQIKQKVSSNSLKAQQMKSELQTPGPKIFSFQNRI
jgi:hypothetical protein